jgi:alkylation response protein AidB-like acyl-CoA dehydrogenase
VAAAARAYRGHPRPSWFAAKENIQTHGGIGFTWEMDCHLYYRRSRQLGLVASAANRLVWKERLITTSNK